MTARIGVVAVRNTGSDIVAVMAVAGAARRTPTANKY